MWLRTTDFGDDKDRVMQKSAAKGGGFTYFLPDVAYHVTKWERGFTRAINIQGADHHSTVTRVRIGLHAGEAIKDGADFYGKNVILASRVASQARGGEILVSSLLRQLVESSIETSVFSQPREAELKGLAGKHVLYAVDWS